MKRGSQYGTFDDEHLKKTLRGGFAAGAGQNDRPHPRAFIPGHKGVSTTRREITVSDFVQMCSRQFRLVMRPREFIARCFGNELSPQQIHEMSSTPLDVKLLLHLTECVAQEYRALIVGAPTQESAKERRREGGETIRAMYECARYHGVETRSTKQQLPVRAIDYLTMTGIIPEVNSGILVTRDGMLLRTEEGEEVEGGYFEEGEFDEE